MRFRRIAIQFTTYQSPFTDHNDAINQVDISQFSMSTERILSYCSNERDGNFLLNKHTDETQVL